MKQTLKKYIVYYNEDNKDNNIFKLYNNEEIYFNSLEEIQNFLNESDYDTWNVEKEFKVCKVDLYKISNIRINDINKKIINESITNLFKKIFDMDRKDIQFMKNISFDIFNYFQRTKIKKYKKDFYEECVLQTHIGKYIYKDNEWLFKFEEEKEIQI